VRSRLYAGTVRHRRTPPRGYAFSYGVFYCYIDLDELDEVDRRSRLLSYNRRNVLAINDRDHLDRGDLRATMTGRLRDRGLLPEGGSVALLTNARVAGHVFNPVSFYLIHDGEGAMHHVVAEVHNTHGERHVYDLAKDAASGTYRSGADKRFYVSPFIDMDARYEFICRERGGDVYLRIDEFAGDELFFQADLRLRAMPLTDANLARMLARYPFVTLKTVAMIHWNGLKLWLRGEPFRKHTAQERGG
jgi:hypothetical protein